MYEMHIELEYFLTAICFLLWTFVNSALCGRAAANQQGEIQRAYHVKVPLSNNLRYGHCG